MKRAKESGRLYRKIRKREFKSPYSCEWGSDFYSWRSTLGSNDAYCRRIIFSSKKVFFWIHTIFCVGRKLLFIHFRSLQTERLLRRGLSESNSSKQFFLHGFPLIKGLWNPRKLLELPIVTNSTRDNKKNGVFVNYFFRIHTPKSQKYSR